MSRVLRVCHALGDALGQHALTHAGSRRRSHMPNAVPRRGCGTSGCGLLALSVLIFAAAVAWSQWGHTPESDGGAARRCLG